jgi:hypothetical protein
VAAEIEAVAVRIDDRLRQPADLILGLEDDDAAAGLGEQIAGGQPCGAAADDDVGASAGGAAGGPRPLPSSSAADRPA